MIRGSGNIKMALESIRSARWRSLLTMMGVIIGVMSVVTTVSLAEGVKRQVSAQINRFGSDLISIRSGRAVKRDKEGRIIGFNLLAGIGTTTLTEADVAVAKKSAYVKTAVPFSIITGIVETGDHQQENGLIIASTEALNEVLNQPIAVGSFFNANDAAKHVAVIGSDAAKELFKELAPIGRSLRIKGENFIVTGIFEEFERNPLNFGADFNSAVFIPFLAGKAISGNQSQIYQILVKPTNPDLLDSAVADLTALIAQNHAGQEDFTVLKQAETEELAGVVLGSLSNLIGGIAAISLLVGGIGIMNVMLAAITERTREIGIRKAIGATNRQILAQFLTEATILSLWGGLIGIGFSGVLNLILRIFTDLKPVITVPIVLVAIAVSIVVGVMFGIIPAMRAARKDPIEALRYE